jgi:hypothetical protein
MKLLGSGCGSPQTRLAVIRQASEMPCNREVLPVLKQIEHATRVEIASDDIRLHALGVRWS